MGNMNFTVVRKNFLIFHLIVIFAIFVSIATGMRIRLLTDDELLWLSPLLPQGAIHDVHFISGIIITSICLVYLFIKKKKANKHQSKYHIWVNRFGYLVIVFAVISGWLQYFQTSQTYIFNAHFTACLLVVCFILLHSYVYLIQFGFKIIAAIVPIDLFKNIRLTAAISSVIALVLVLYIGLDTNKHQQMIVSTIDYQDFIDIDGKDQETFWQKAKAVKVFTSGGANFINGSTEVTIKSAANPQEIYFLFQWQDPTQSLLHMPIVKDNGQWTIKQDGFYQFDEQTFYEDKFAVLVSKTCDFGADGTAKLGPKPIKGKPQNFHKKGYHVSPDHTVRDLWHWKAVRTNKMILMDDNYIGKAKTARTGERRYTAGYAPDGKESGAYVMNWQWYQRDSIKPKRLPIEPSFITKNTHISKASILPWFESKPYNINDDKYDDGTLLPSVLYRSNRFEGDRADIRAKGTWDKGVWTLELARKRNTGSKHDVVLENDVCIWASAFDRSQIAHTRHERPIQLKFASL